MASERLGDPNFARTVVLMVAHDEDGALGVVLNRPLPLTLHALAEGISADPPAREGMLFRGGPCETSVLAVFDDLAADGGTPVLPGVRFTAEPGLIRRLLTHAEGRARFFAGYAGWSAGQLESELDERAWLLLPARPEHVFAKPELIWNLARTELVLGQPLKPAVIPLDPTMN